MISRKRGSPARAISLSTAPVTSSWVRMIIVFSVWRRDPAITIAPVEFPPNRRRLGSWHGTAAPSPRLRGEGRGEGASPQAQTRGEAPSPAPTFGGGDLSAHAGRGERLRLRRAQLPSP